MKMYIELSLLSIVDWHNGFNFLCSPCFDWIPCLLYFHLNPQCLIKRIKVLDEHINECWERDHMDAVRQWLIEPALHTGHALINTPHWLLCLSRIAHPGLVATVCVAEDIVPARNEPLDWMTCGQKEDFRSFLIQCIYPFARLTITLVKIVYNIQYIDYWEY